MRSAGWCSCRDGDGARLEGRQPYFDVALGPLLKLNKRHCRIELGLIVDTDLLQDRPQDLAEPVACLFRLPNIDNAETLRALPCRMHQ
jgi:hypothetical protein